MSESSLTQQDQAEYARRRKRLMKAIGKRSAVVVPAAEELIRNNDNHYPFRQSSDFHYLTGLNEPDALLVLCPKRSEGEIVLFVQPNTPEKVRWDGPLTGLEDACRVYGADQAFPIDEIDDHLPELLAGYERLTLPFANHEWMLRALSWLDVLRQRGRSGIVPPQTLKDLAEPLHELRLIKSPIEISRMRRAAAISAEAHRFAASAIAEDMYEFEVAAHLQRVFYQHHGEASFAPIVATGANACILHYRANAARLESGQLVLVDAGAEIEHYAGDITRVWPVDGIFTAAQRAVYEIVLNAQLAAIDAIQPGVPYNAPHLAAVRVIAQGLLDLGLLEGSIESVIESATYKRFFMHNTGHWLGLDVHDVGRYKVDGEWRELAPGMVLTVEPGIYIDQDVDIPEAYRGIGIRIEDDVLVTETGAEVLTHGVPKTVADIESFMNRSTAGKALDL
ncbi:Xaa-Pro aminopeptidase [Halothiobacillus diazotrophicus]|uniref:Xaa-Pro aminopeptidase n=1 Tax=Halothiobacillus diazotrophicus TaxID=1860122 RepID=A0A191ZEV7_9GAMM|nr:aminopeptidase P N-terminal domain-containing protein [Halothiobacillus diazotrophicus]ANJ66411.1 Xaa-Pro aminopeptidase [Halothiobacillus diazotrophicus]